MIRAAQVPSTGHPEMTAWDAGFASSYMTLSIQVVGENKGQQDVSDTVNSLLNERESSGHRPKASIQLA